MENLDKGLDDQDIRKVLLGLDEKAIRRILIPENILGEGHSKQCFKIPDVSEFVLAVMKDSFNPDTSIDPFVVKEDMFGDPNLGQTIAISPSGLKLMKRVYGEPHGSRCWINKSIAYNLGLGELSKEDGISFYAQIRDIATYPIDSYKFLAQQLKILDEHNIRIDALNPNNILVDASNKQFHIIDFEDSRISRNLSNYPRPLNGVHDMHCLLLDAHLHNAWLQTMPVEFRDDFIGSSKMIIQKCNDAAAEVDLNTSYDCTITNIKTISDMLPEQKIWEYYLLFAKMYTNEF